MKRLAARDYAAIEREIDAIMRDIEYCDPSHELHSGGRAVRMSMVVDALWDHLRDTGVSWVGFYIELPGEPDHGRLVLGPCRDKPACSPIGLHGVCGQALVSRQTRIVRDVRELGDHYIACHPRDRSEIVIPLIDESGRCWSVLDLDSHEVGSFDDSDEAGLRQVLAAAGLLEGNQAQEKKPPMNADERR